MWEFLDREIKKAAEDSKETRPLAVCHPAPGQTCPNCRNEKLEYNNLLNLVCPACGFESTASFT